MNAIGMILVLFLQILVVYCQDDIVGRVFIGVDENDTVTSAFSFNENYAGNTNFYVPVYIGLFNSTTDEPILDYSNDLVTITCELVDLVQIGYTGVSFDSKLIQIPAVTQAEITFKDVTAGRPSPVQCWGTSSSYFTKESSVTNIISFEIRPKGIANILDPVIIVPDTEIENFETEFIVQLTETVEINNISISCQNTSSVATMELLIPKLNVLVGSDRATMKVTVIDRGNGMAYIACKAQSENNGLQFREEEGSQSVFSLEEADVTLVPIITNLYYPQMVSYLVLDAQPKSGIIYYCNLTIVETLEEAALIRNSTVCEIPDGLAPTRAPILTGSSTTTDAPVTGSSTSTTTQIPVNVTGYWELLTSTIEFTAEDSRFKEVLIQRTNRIQSVRPELIVVRCCAPDEPDTDRKYRNTSAALLTVAYLSEEKSINWTTATLLDDLETETEVINPAYVELSPCPCDKTFNYCDVDCCCDSDCTAQDNDTFQCIPGIYGGYGKEGDNHYKCSTNSYNKPDWFPLMCVEFENSGFLGYYRSPQSALRDSSGYQNIRNNFESFSYSETLDRFDDSTAEALDPYKEGYAIKTGIRSTSSVYTSNYFRLTLPQRSLTGACISSAPVQYLKEMENSCVYDMSENLCSEFSVLSALIYVQNTGVWEYQAAPQVLQGNAETVIAFTNVNYYCLTDDETLAYVSKVSQPSDFYTVDKTFIFDDVKTNFTNCEFDTKTSAYICGDIIFEQDNDTTPTYTRCSWDNGFTQPPSPIYNNNMCENSVVDVLYNFTWKGSEIERLDATVLLGTIPMFVERTDSVTIKYVNESGFSIVDTTNVTNQFTARLSQNFQATWHHNLNDTNPDENDSSFAILKRSGNPGYLFNLPIFTGLGYRNETTDEFLYIDTNLSKSITMWDPSPSGLCETSGKKLIDFGVNHKSSCALRLSLDDLRDCDNLRKLILLNQDNLMLSNYISFGGNPNRTDLTDWLPIYRQDISSIINDNIPETDDTTTVDYNATQETTTESTETNVTFSYLDTIIGRCPNIPSNIHIDIMYALVGKLNYIPIYAILGAKISYSLNEWKLYCVGKDGTACYNDPSWLESTASQVQTFTISSSVQFIEVPPSKPNPLTEYEKRKGNNTPNHYICYQDSCWNELVYPLTEAYIGEPRLYALGFGLISIVYFVSYFFLTKPWW